MGWLGSVRLGWVGLCVVLWFWKGSVGLCWLAIMFTTVVNFRHPWRSSLQLSSISCIHCSHVDNCRHFQASSASKSTTVVILGLSLVSSLELSSFSGSHCSHLYNCRHFQASTVPCAHDRGCICRLFAYYLHTICILFAYYLQTTPFANLRILEKSTSLVHVPLFAPQNHILREGWFANSMQIVCK